MNLPSFEAQPAVKAAVEAPAWVKHRKLIDWVQRVAAMTRPDNIVWCDGSQEEYDRLCAQMVEAGTLRKLNPAKRPNSYPCLVRSVRRRARRGPHLHLRATSGRRGPHQQLGRAARNAHDTRRPLRRLRCAAARMYVVPFSMGPLGSPIAHIGVELSATARTWSPTCAS